MTLMKTSQKGIDLIKQFEGCRLKAYKPVQTEKYLTIGFGHYGADVKPNMVITQAQAEDLLKRDIIAFEGVLNAMGINFTQNQFDALISWQYNLGASNFQSSTMYKYIRARKSDLEITDQMVKWVNSNGKPLLGLKRRRVAEANMFLNKEVYFVNAKGEIKKK